MTKSLKLCNIVWQSRQPVMLFHQPLATKPKVTRYTVTIVKIVLLEWSLFSNYWKVSWNISSNKWFRTKLPLCQAYSLPSTLHTQLRLIRLENYEDNKASSVIKEKPQIPYARLQVYISKSCSFRLLSSHSCDSDDNSKIFLIIQNNRPWSRMSPTTSNMFVYIYTNIIIVKLKGSGSPKPVSL